MDIVKCISLLHSLIVGFEGYCCRLHSRLSQHDSLSLPATWATSKQRTNKLGRCHQPERPFCTLTRFTLRRRTAAFTYTCLSAQVSGRETRVHAGRWHAGHGLTRCQLALAAQWRRLVWLLTRYMYSISRTVSINPVLNKDDNQTRRR